MIHQNFNGFMEESDHKFEKLQEQIGLLMQRLSGVMSVQGEEDDHIEEIEDEIDEETELTLQSKGMFRDPDHAAKLRQKQVTANPTRKNEELRSGGTGVNHEGAADFHSLKHLKLTFPSLKLGGDAMEWLRDCEEYFSIFEVNDHRRSIAGLAYEWDSKVLVQVFYRGKGEAFLARVQTSILGQVWGVRH